MTEESSRLNRAVALVMADVSTKVGQGVITVGSAEQFGADALAKIPGWLASGSEAWVHLPGEMAGVALVDDDRTFPDLVVLVAGVIQEFVFEHVDRTGASTFPPCPEHPTNPLWPEVLDGHPVWRCQQGGDTRVPIGHLD